MTPTPAPEDTRSPARPEFPTTCWSRILGANAAQRDLEQLARGYWRPVYGAIRSHGKNIDEARDLTQEFFAWLLQGDVVGRADPARGRFRAFLKTVLRRFLISAHRRDTALRRGGGHVVQPLDLGGAALPDLQALRLDEQPPDQVLDALWRAALVQRATDALERDLVAAGHAVQWQVFRDYFESAEELDYQAVAQRYGLSTAQVSNALQRTKQRYRALLRAAVRETVTDTEELQAELRWLFGEDA